MKRTSGFVLPLAFSALAAIQPTPVDAAVDMFLDLEGIMGESQDAKHAGEIDVLAWSWQLSRPVDSNGNLSPEPIVRAIKIEKYTDLASPKIYEALINGTTIPTASLVVRNTGAKTLEDYIKIDMTDVIITGVANGGSGGEDRLTESISINFSSVTFTYTEQLEDGSAGGTGGFQWDITPNTQP